jgi:hypothetical protein
MAQNPHIITLSEAETMTHAYQQASQFQGLTVACRIDNKAYQEVMTQPGCVGIRTYFALNAQGDLTIVAVGVDESGNDITNGVLLNRAYDCPSECAPNSPLLA